LNTLNKKEDTAKLIEEQTGGAKKPGKLIDFDF